MYSFQFCIITESGKLVLGVSVVVVARILAVSFVSLFEAVFSLGLWQEASKQHKIKDMEILIIGGFDF